MTSHHPPKNELQRLGSELLGEGLSVRMHASGYSMFPYLRPGDIIEIVPFGGTGATLIAGEIVALKRDNDFVVHRFLGYFEKEGRRWLFTRGDSTLRADEPFPSEALAGRVVAVSRGNRVIRNPRPRTNIFYRWNRLMVIILHKTGLLAHK
jgi:hypothetical protein